MSFLSRALAVLRSFVSRSSRRPRARLTVEPLEERAALAVCVPSGPVLDALGSCRNWITFTPPRPYNPDHNAFPSRAQIRAALRQLRQEGWRGLVTYSLDGSLAAVPRLARQVGFTSVIAGLFWFDDARLARERQAAVAEAAFIDGFVVGNEGLLFGRYGRPRLEAEMNALRAVTGKPVTTTETGGQCLRDPSLLALGDWVFPNVHPWFASIRSVPEAVQFTVNEVSPAS